MYINLLISHYRKGSHFYRTNLSILLFPPDGATGEVCPVESHCPVGSAAPVACTPGSYSNNTGAAVCDVCPAGSHCVDGASALPCPRAATAPRGQGPPPCPAPRWV